MSRSSVAYPAERLRASTFIRMPGTGCDSQSASAAQRNEKPGGTCGPARLASRRALTSGRGSALLVARLANASVRISLNSIASEAGSSIIAQQTHAKLLTQRQHPGTNGILAYGVRALGFSDPVHCPGRVGAILQLPALTVNWNDIPGWFQWRSAQE